MPMSGNIWPVHFPPYQDEAFTSWFSRLSLYHFQVPSTFFKYNIPYRVDSWKQDLDVVCPDVILTEISRKCSQQKSSLYKHTFHCWRDRFDPYDGSSTALPRWITPTFIRRKTTHHHGWRMCIMCMRHKPYLKLFSRFHFTLACVEHRVVLIDKCSYCNYPVSSHKIFEPLFRDGVSDGLAFCHYCGHDFRLDKPAIASEAEIDLTSFCTQTVVKGHCEIGINSLQYSHLFFEGFRLVCKALLRPRLRELLDARIPEFDPSVFYQYHQHEIEFLSIEDARRILVLGKWLLEEWPSRFLDISTDLKLCYSDWILPRDIFPYWFGSVTNKHLRRGRIIMK